MWFSKSQGDRAARVAIITGGTRGIGLATARAFLGQGARVGICGVDPERLREAHAGLEPLGEVEAVVADVRFISQVQAFVERVSARFGVVDVLVMDGTLVDQGRAVLSAMASARLTPSEAATLMQALAAQGRLVETEDLAQRVEELEIRCNEGHIDERIKGADH